MNFKALSRFFSNKISRPFSATPTSGILTNPILPTENNNHYVERIWELFFNSQTVANKTLAEKLELGKTEWNRGKIIDSLKHFESIKQSFEGQKLEHITPWQADKLAQAYCYLAKSQTHSNTSRAFVYAQKALKLNPKSQEAHDLIAGIESEGLLEFEQREKTAAPPKPRH